MTIDEILSDDDDAAIDELLDELSEVLEGVPMEQAYMAGSYIVLDVLDQLLETPESHEEAVELASYLITEVANVLRQVGYEMKTHILN